jgi:HSP20 family protein
VGGALVKRGEFPLLFGRLRDELERLFGDFVPGWPVADFVPRWGLEVKEKNGAVVVRAELPGFEATDFDVEVRDGCLVLSATHKVKKEEKGEASEEVEREYYESVLLPPGVDAEKVTAEYKSGVLTVTLPRAPGAVGRKVPVTTA